MKRERLVARFKNSREMFEFVELVSYVNLKEEEHVIYFTPIAHIVIEKDIGIYPEAWYFFIVSSFPRFLFKPVLWIGIISFYFDVGPDPYPSSSYKQVGKSKFFYFYSQQCHCFIFLISVIGVIIFSIWTAY
jgi:hypothetical protein